MKKFLLFVVLPLILIPVGIQLIPVSRTNPKADPKLAIKMNETVTPVLKKACFDCHSNETVWPWYSDWAPVSWVVATNVEKGRKALNFSEWEKNQDTKERFKTLEQIKKLTKRRVMPMLLYTWQHPEATLKWEEIGAIHDWVDSMPEMVDQIKETVKK